MNTDLPPPIFEQLADHFKTLSEPSRLQILAAICQEERNVTEICQMTGLNQANVSKHLQLLKIAKIVACRRDGICRYYRIVNPEILALCHEQLTK
ncbi:metalloregulator ArsR/SmtB family transcription factor [Spirulina subsalsa FACHB-351]|uniref:Metalloregulator ArsR/SmtB family transcription factor n=1 Tax=Spirulina subsalsa FACHB-351 TaxID=234711 RepID=A0ABT3L7K8_9CYAN|nr:metalloregulator ArsR/SmtB family transcription factor [Spirulina subsalsa]MCW6037074.1 metalloregulator ArsR/SmtB family transcription factor [Spirulina subsalsa FACHB-351]